MQTDSTQSDRTIELGQVRLKPIATFLAQRLKRESTGSDIAQSSVWNLLIRVGGMGASLLLGILLARYLGPSQFGVYGILISLALIMSVAARLGFPSLATRELAVAVHRQDWALAKGVIHWFGRTIGLLSLMASALLLVAVGFIQDAQPDWSGYALWCAALIPLFALSALVGAELRGLDRLVAGQSLDSFVRPGLTCAFCIAAIFYLGSMTTTVALGVNVIASAITLGLGILLLRRWMPPALKSARPERHGRRWGKSALLLGAVDGLRQIDANYGLMILGALGQTVEAGYLRVVLSAIVLVSLPQTVVHLVMAPTLARLSASGDRAQLQEILSRASASLAVVTLIFLLTLVAVGQPLIELMFGSAYSPAWLPLLLFSTAQLIHACFGVGWILLTMAGGERQLAQFYAISLAVGVIAGIPLCIAYGANGACSAAIVGALIQNILVWRHVRLKHSVDCSLFAVGRSKLFG
jgi:O-antigen/teichoic acid export membrane protein